MNLQERCTSFRPRSSHWRDRHMRGLFGPIDARRLVLVSNAPTCYFGVLTEAQGPEEQVRLLTVPRAVRHLQPSVPDPSLARRFARRLTRM